MMRKLLTVVVPSYNMEKYLPKCLGSLILDDKRLLSMLEVIVVNDGSKDRTSEIAHEFSACHPDVVRVIDKPNGHYGSCINAALKVAQGQYMRILDADDTFDVSNLQEYLRKIESCGGSPDSIVCDVARIDESGSVTRVVSFPYISEGISKFSALPPVIGNDFMLQAPFAFRTSMLRDMNYRQSEGIAYTDAEWATLPFARVDSLLYVKLPVYRYLIGRAGQSIDELVIRSNYWMSAVTGLNCLRQFLRLKKMDERLNEAYVLDRCARLILSTYKQVLFAVHTIDADVRLAQTDDELRMLSPEMYDVIEHRGVAVKGCFRYVKIWRRCKSSRCWSLRAFRLLQRAFL